MEEERGKERILVPYVGRERKGRGILVHYVWKKREERKGYSCLMEEDR